MIDFVAEEIYCKSLQLKKYNKTALLRKRKRLALIVELNELQRMLEPIIRTEPDGSPADLQHCELAAFMSETLSDCCLKLSGRRPDNLLVILKLWGFHNLARAFLANENPMKISPEEALDYFSSYQK